MLTSVLVLMLSAAPDSCYETLPSDESLVEKAETVLSALRALSAVRNSGSRTLDDTIANSAYWEGDSLFAHLDHLRDLVSVARQHKSARKTVVAMIRSLTPYFDHHAKALNSDFGLTRHPGIVAEIIRLRTVAEALDSSLRNCPREP